MGTIIKTNRYRLLIAAVCLAAVVALLARDPVRDVRSTLLIATDTGQRLDSVIQGLPPSAVRWQHIQQQTRNAYGNCKTAKVDWRNRECGLY